MFRAGRSGFTLIEVLIVVVIMAVLAATIIPQFSDSAKDAKESSVRFNLHTLRSQIELYRVQHSSVYPTGANNLEQLTKRTDVTGAVMPSGGTAANYPYGPYVHGALPVNPFTNGNKVTLDTGTGAPTPSGDSDAGYLYRAATGEIWLDDANYLTY
jgi:type II secretion system protein G